MAAMPMAFRAKKEITLSKMAKNVVRSRRKRIEGRRSRTISVGMRISFISIDCMKDIVIATALRGPQTWVGCRSYIGLLATAEHEGPAAALDHLTVDLRPEGHEIIHG